jgi:hypothetical protein
MQFDELTNGNYMMYALLHYDNQHCIDIKEFFEDVKRLHYIRRLFKRYKDDGVLKERLIINHLVIFYNVFTAPAATRILFFKVEKEYHPVLKTFLVYLNKISYSYDKHLSADNIELDEHTIKKLRNLA